jgi:predicted DNA-binding transcriptional regulator YafY
MRASRVLSLLMLLQSRGRLSASALARELEVSMRTVLRDIDELSASGVPIWAERGRDGGFQLNAGWSTQLTGMTADESQALLLAGLPKAASDLGMGQAAASARLKLLHGLPSELREQAISVSTKLHLDATDWFRESVPPVHLQALADAVWHQRKILVRYQSWTRINVHRLKPLGLVLKAGTWYFVALRDAEAGPARVKKVDKNRFVPNIYKLASVLEFQGVFGSFTRPKQYDLPSFWQTATQRFEAEIYRDEAIVKVSEAGLRMLRALSPAVAAAVHRQVDPQRVKAGTWVQLRIPIESVQHATLQLISLGADLVVIEPKTLRVAMRSTVAQMAAHYRERSTSRRKVS